MLRLSWEAFEALQIFEGRQFKTQHKSLFEIFSSQLQTIAGRRLLRTWFLRPSTDIDFINTRLDNLEYFLKQNSLRQEVQTVLGEMNCDVESLLMKLKRKTKAGDWRAILKFIGGALKLRQMFLKAFPQVHNAEIKTPPDATAAIVNKALCLFVEKDLRDIGACVAEIVRIIHTYKVTA